MRTHLIERGAGDPIIMIPGIQGRWEWMSPAVAALADHHRVITFSLPATPRTAALDSLFDDWMRHLDQVFARTGLTQAALMGVSFGGLIAARYAARRPDRVSSLVLVSTPAPRMPLFPEAARYLRHPTLALPFFAVRGCRNLLPETLAARASWPARARFVVEHGLRVLRYPIAPATMARWVRAWQATDLAGDCRRVSAPTLLVTGEAALDRVVPVSSTREYLTLIPGATHTVLPRTGHVGLVTRPQAFARLVEPFVDAHPPAHDHGTPADAGQGHSASGRPAGPAMKQAG